MVNEGKLSIPFFPDTEDVRQRTKTLTNMIRHTEDYKCYQKNLTVLKGREELYRKFKEFRGKSLHLQVEKGQEQYFEKVEALHSEYKDLLTEPVVVDFLSAEQRICKLMRIVYDGIAEDIRLDLSYMDEFQAVQI